RIEKPLLERLKKALSSLEQLASDKGWQPDWPLVRESQEEAARLEAAGDIPGAFREYCRAMLPLTRAMHERRRKEEVFRPVWDKSR
ncbi:MAG: hypothetical protein SNJ75_18855, partial [Gemmataceae bacterium]